MLKRVLAVLVGVVVGVCIVYLAQLAMHSMHVAPKNALKAMDEGDMKPIADYIKTLPASAFLMLIGGYALAAFFAAFVCTSISKENKAWVISVGLLFAFTAMTFASIPHPTWVSVCGLLVYPILGFLGYYFSAKSIQKKLVSE